MKVIDLIKEVESYNKQAELFGQDKLTIRVESEFTADNKKEFVKRIKETYNEPENLLDAEVTRIDGKYFIAQWTCYGTVSKTEFYIKVI